ncbi:MAG: multidrug efflux SMR transporter [Thermoplasmatales archaeon]|nr:multidrug efflux SMR transporter [Thermoplasmatales archaeon]
MAWAYLLIAGLLEPCWVITMERSDRFRRIPWAAATVAIMAASLYLLSLAMAVFGPGTSYAVWTGIGAVCTVALGIVVYDEPATIRRVFFIFLIVVGIVGVNLASGGAIDG